MSTGGGDIAIADWATVALRLFLTLSDSLHAERTFFHDAVLPDRHVGIELLFQRWIPVGIEPVELPRRIRTIIAAVAHPDASVIDLGVEALRGVIRRVDRTDRLTRRIGAVLAEHGHEPRFDVGICAFPIALDADPIDGAAVGCFSGAGNADIIFSMAGDDAGLAAGASIQVDHHLPSVRAGFI